METLCDKYFTYKKFDALLTKEHQGYCVLTENIGTHVFYTIVLGTDDSPKTQALYSASITRISHSFRPLRERFLSKFFEMATEAYKEYKITHHEK